MEATLGVDVVGVPGGNLGSKAAGPVEEGGGGRGRGCQHAVRVG